jgi:hypothetical protein
MAQQTIDIGAAANDSTGDSLRDGFDKVNDNFTEIYGFVGGGVPVYYTVACSDETTAITAGADKVKWRAPHAMTVTAVRGSLSTAQTSVNTFTVDIHEAGTTILSTKITIANGSKTSVGGTPPVISDAAIADDAELTFDVDQIGDGTAKGLKVTIIGTKV